MLFCEFGWQEGRKEVRLMNSLSKSEKSEVVDILFYFDAFDNRKCYEILHNGSPVFKFSLLQHRRLFIQGVLIVENFTIAIRSR